MDVIQASLCILRLLLDHSYEWSHTRACCNTKNIRRCLRQLKSRGLNLVSELMTWSEKALVKLLNRLSKQPFPYLLITILLELMFQINWNFSAVLLLTWSYSVKSRHNFRTKLQKSLQRVITSGFYKQI